MELTEGQIRYRKYRKSYKAYRTKNKEKGAKGAKEWRSKSRFGGLRYEILKRDGFKCVKCGMTREQHFMRFGRDITIDHTNGKGRYSKIKDNRPENLVTLCLFCHGRKDRVRYLEMIRKGQTLDQEERING